MAFKIKENVSWVGKVDWELRKFHGEEYSTHRGSSYNSYLVKDEKTALIDTVWGKFSGEFVESLKKEIPLEKIAMAPKFSAVYRSRQEVYSRQSESSPPATRFRIRRP